jgi:molybdopterin-guanine dinucleotide biosynthesis protein A
MAERMTICHDTPSVAAAILAGGRASRYGGRSKGSLRRPEGTTLLEHLRRELRRAGIRRVVLAGGSARAYRRCGLAILPDARRDAGPLAGIEAALDHYAGRCNAVLFMPCDLPGIGAEEIRRLLDAYRRFGPPGVFAVTGRFFPHPLCIIVHTGALPRVREALEAGRLKPRDLWRRLGVRVVRFPDPAPFCNVNTPEEMRRWRQGVLRSRRALKTDRT